MILAFARMWCFGSGRFLGKGSLCTERSSRWRSTSLRVRRPERNIRNGPGDSRKSPKAGTGDPGKNKQTNKPPGASDTTLGHFYFLIRNGFFCALMGWHHRCAVETSFCTFLSMMTMSTGCVAAVPEVYGGSILQRQVTPLLTSSSFMLKHHLPPGEPAPLNVWGCLSSLSQREG